MVSCRFPVVSSPIDDSDVLCRRARVDGPRKRMSDRLSSPPHWRRKHLSDKGFCHSRDARASRRSAPADGQWCRPDHAQQRCRRGPVFIPDREVCEYFLIAGQRLLRTPHCCLPHTVCNLVTVSVGEGTPARVKEVHTWFRSPRSWNPIRRRAKRFPASECST